jgi:hypothetical protein
MTTADVPSLYLRDIVRTFRHHRALGDAALAQVSDAGLHAPIDPDANSIALVVKHLSGNLRSRFSDFLTTDGEKPDRNRDLEFEMVGVPTRSALVGSWNEAWTIAMASIEALTPEDLTRTVYIRGEAFEVVEALNRLATHTAYHIGQIVLLAKHDAGPAWRSLSIPRGRSSEVGLGRYKQGEIEERAKRADAGS